MMEEWSDGRRRREELANESRTREIKVKKQEKVVLVIEDDAEMILLLRVMFREQGVKLVPKLTGEESLAAMKALEPDLVLLDINLPGLDGWEIYQQMQASPELREIPIIVVTIRSESVCRRNGHSFDAAAGFVRKPFDPRSLVALVRDCLELETVPSSVERSA